MGRPVGVGDPEDGGGMGVHIAAKSESGRLNNAQVRWSSWSTCARCSHYTHGTQFAQRARYARSIAIMLGSAVVLASLLACVAGFPARGVGELERRSALDDWIAKQEAVAYAGVLDNVGDAGLRSFGAKRGLVLASPSTVDPDCEFLQVFL